MLGRLWGKIRSWVEATWPAQGLLDQPALPGQVVDYYRAHLELSTGTAYAQFMQFRIRPYLHALASFCTGEGERPACTVANVLTLALYPDCAALLRVLASQELEAGPLYNHHLQQLLSGQPLPYSLEQLLADQGVAGRAAPIHSFLLASGFNGRPGPTHDFAACQRQQLGELPSYLGPALLAFTPTKRALRATAALHRRLAAG